MVVRVESTGSLLEMTPLHIDHAPGYLLSCGLLSNFLGSCPEKSNWSEEAEAQEAVVPLVSCYPQTAYRSAVTASSQCPACSPPPSLWEEALAVSALGPQTVACGKDFAFLKRGIPILLWLLFFLSCHPHPHPIPSPSVQLSSQWAEIPKQPQRGEEPSRGASASTFVLIGSRSTWD